jgi:hypothetical protein
MEPVGVRTGRRRLWPWFVAGFFSVFVGMLVAATAYYMHPSGEALVQCKLWEYYLVQIPRMFQTQNLGPTAGDSSATLTMLFQHLICAIAGGLVGLGVGWFVQKK